MNEFLVLYLPPVFALLGIAGYAHYRLLEKPSYRGWWGEYKVNFLLRLCLSREYKIFTNALYRGKQSGEATQVDHIVVSRYGVFVIETKSFKGKVITDPCEPQTWQQIVGRRKYRLQNPLYQNHSHVKAIQRVTGLHGYKLHSYAAMAGSATFPDGMPDRVFSPWRLVRKIQSQRTPVLTRSHVDEICRSLERSRIKGGYWAAQRHVEKLGNRKAD